MLAKSGDRNKASHIRAKGYPMSHVSTGEKQDANAPGKEALERERYELLQRLEEWLETPMLILAFIGAIGSGIDLGHKFCV
jgi:biopolymer transport protein ExbB/TolQ